MNIRIASAGYPVIAAAVIMTGISYIPLLFAQGPWLAVNVLCSAALTIFSMFTVYFFRDPDRATELSPAACYAPADGTVLDVATVTEPRYVGGPCMRISVFMSVFNVHVNRSPVRGVVDFVYYNTGKFIAAFREKASEENESLFIGIQCADAPEKIAVHFIAGLIARRIVFYRKKGDAVGQGERINMIRFGSRVDLYVPPDAEIKTKKGSRVTAGRTVLAVLKDG